MELKTLKDIKKYYPMCLRRQGDILLMGKASEDKMKEYEKKELIDVNVLRQSAIDDIKDLREKSIAGGCGDPLDEDRECKNGGDCGDAGFCVDPNPEVICYIQMKFNIEESDLK